VTAAAPLARGVLGWERGASLLLLLAMLPTLLAGGATLWVFGPHTLGNDFVRSAIWGLVLLASFVGWGGACGRLLISGERLDWGLASAVGMAVLLAIGGVLQVLHLMLPATVVVLTLAGLVALAADRLRRRQELVAALAEVLARTRRAPITASVVSVLYVLALVVYAGNMATPVMGRWDDAEAYLAYPKALLAHGSLEEPFSFRRLGALGGQSWLQSLLLVGATPTQLNGFDNGICQLSIFGMVHGYARGRRATAVIAMLFVVAFTYPFHNLASALSGTVFFLALFRVLDGRGYGDLTSRRVAILIGLLAAAAWTLRQNYMVALLAILGATYGLRWLDEARHARRQVIRGLISMLGALILFLTPWWVVAYRSSATFLFPILAGNGRPNVGVLGRASLGEELQFFVLNALWNRPVRTILIFVLAGLFLHEKRRDRVALAFLIGAGVGVVALIHALSALDDITSVSRYYMAFEYAFVLAVLLKSLDRVESGERPIPVRLFVSAALAVLAVGIHIWDTRGDIQIHHAGSTQRVADQTAVPQSMFPDSNDLLYQRIQASIPPGATFLEILDEPFRLDFRRNRILLCDQPGGAGPKPGWPVRQGSEQYEQYFRSHGIRYVAFILGRDSPEYDHARWAKFLAREELPKRNGHSSGALLRDMAALYVDAFEALDDLSKRKRHLFHEGSIHVLDLDTPAL
jgi:hypothetical protein